MMDKSTNWWHRSISYSFLLAIAIMVYHFGSDRNNIESRAFSNVEQKWKVIAFVDTFDLTEAEFIGIVTHSRDTIAHISNKERIMYYKRMNINDSLVNLFMVEQWKQGRRLERIEDTVNKLNNK